MCLQSTGFSATAIRTLSTIPKESRGQTSSRVNLLLRLRCCDPHVNASLHRLRGICELCREPSKHLDCEDKLEEFRKRRQAESGEPEKTRPTRSSRKWAAAGSSGEATPIESADAAMEIAEAGGQSSEPSISLPRAPSESAVSDPSTQSPKQLTNTPPESAPMPQPRPAKQQAASARASAETSQSVSVDAEMETPADADEAAHTSSGAAIGGRNKKKRSESNEAACVVRRCMSNN